MDLKYKNASVGKWRIKKKIVINSGTESPPSSKPRILSTQCGGITGGHPAHCSSVTSTPGVEMM